MEYSPETRVVHIGDVANTASNLVATARQMGRAWSVRPVPAAPSLRDPLAWTRRGLDLGRYILDSPRPGLQHIHYGPNGYYGLCKRAPYVLHLHGTDLRQDLHRPLLGQLERAAIRGAARVLVATPDLLAEAKNERADAMYLPNPVPLRAYQAPAPDTSPVGSEPHVFFASRWDDSKGGENLVEVARALTSQGVRVDAIDWGTHAASAQRAGVRLRPMLPPNEFREAISAATLVVGQFSFGSLGVADLETLSKGKPLIGYVASDLEPTYPYAGITLEDAVPLALRLLEDPGEARKRGTAGRNWVIRERSPVSAVRDLERVYADLLSQR